MKKKINKRTVKCENCGGNLVFSPHFQCLVCEKCDSKISIVISKNYVKHKFNKIDNEIDKRDVKRNFSNVNCHNCGALIDNKDLEISKICPYCFSPVVLDVFNKEIKPDAIIPFQFDKNEARTRLINFIKYDKFLPDRFRKLASIENIEGFYIPAFAFYQKTESDYKGSLEFKRIVYDNEGSHTERYNYDVKGNISYNFENVLVECSSRLTQEEINGVGPCNISKIVAFNEDFLRGYSLETYNEKLIDTKLIGDKIIDSNIRKNIMYKYRAERINNLDVKTKRSNEKYCYIILPIYKFNYNYLGKKYITYMNGETGIIFNNFPKSKIKITYAIIIPILLIITFIILAIIS